MSLDKCEYCRSIVDTDDDPDCYQPYPSMPLKDVPDICVCEPCREKQENEREQAP